MQGTHSGCGVSGRRRDGQLALFGVPTVTARRCPVADVFTVVGDPGDGTGPDCTDSGCPDSWGCPDCGAESVGAWRVKGARQGIAQRRGSALDARSTD